jgi:hypothetical protein
MTSLATVTFEGLKLRMWSDFMRAHETASLKTSLVMRSTTNEMRCFPGEFAHGDKEKFQVHGMAISRTQDAGGRIRGGHAPRRRIVIDEAQDVGAVIYEALPNPMSAPDAKAVFLSQPYEKLSPFGSFCEPVNGWGIVGCNDLIWETKKGGVCLHLNGLESPNVKAGKNLWTGLLTTERVEEVRRTEGEQSVSWSVFILGWFPADGLVARIWETSTILKAREVITYDFPPQMCASCDPAYEEDEAPLHFGQMGMARNGRLSINATERLVMKYVISDIAEPKEYQLAHWIMEQCRIRQVAPRNFIMDTTGNGRGCYAILQKEWSPDVQKIEYGGQATERPVRGDYADRACDLYQWFVTELWFRAKNAVLDGILGGLGNTGSLTEEDLHARRYEPKQVSKGRVLVAEKKEDLKKRLGRSPNDGDCFCQFGELLARMGSFPGLALKSNSPSSKWGRQRERAKKASRVYEDEGRTQMVTVENEKGFQPWPY